MVSTKTPKSKPVVKKSNVKQSNACCTFDFTLFDDKNVYEVRNILKEISKRYTFQKEKGEKTERLHFQGRFSLKIRKREPELAKLLRDKGWDKFNISITCTKNRDNSFYVMKEESRMEGPFTDENDIFIPKDILKIKELRPWQKTLIDTLNTYDERTIDVIFDEKGNIGKSTLTRFMMLYHDAELLPFCNDYKDIMRMAYDIGPKKTYLIDMPRAISKEKLFQFFSGVETLKSGYCYDDRYCFKRRLFDRPRICIFTNTFPDTTLLSKDMWKIWKIDNNCNLVEYKNEVEEELENDLDNLPLEKEDDGNVIINNHSDVIFFEELKTPSKKETILDNKPSFNVKFD